MMNYFMLLPIATILCLTMNHSDGAKSMLSMNRTIDLHEVHLDDGRILRRNKRFLLFSGGGISKVVLGFLAPVELPDRVNWRTLNLAYNFQAQYVPLPSTAYLWNVFSRSLVNQRRRFDVDGTYNNDGTRDIFYAAIEMFLNHRGKAGRDCLLKAICDIAAHPIEVKNIFDEIIHLILTPNETREKGDYVDAKMAGMFGENCTKLYEKCAFGDGILDHISQLVAV